NWPASSIRPPLSRGLFSVMRRAPARPCCRPPPGRNCSPGSASAPGPGTGRRGRWNCAPTGWIPCGRTWTRARTCGPPWRWGWGPARPRPPRACWFPGSRLPVMQATAYTYDPESRSGQVLLDDGTPVPFDAPAFDAGGLRLLRPGQRVRVETEGEGEDRRITLVTLYTF